MTTYPQPLTKLEAVNICLSAMGEPAVNALEDVGIDAQMASDLIDEQSRNVQLKGWHWNREVHTFQPEAITGYINLPHNVGKVDSTDISQSIDVVQRGLRLFNRGTNSYTFTNPLTIELYVILPFDELPLAGKSFIAYNSAMILQQRLLGSATIDSYLKDQKKDAWTELVRDNDEVQDANMLKDNWSTMSIVQRGQFRRGGYI